MGLKIFLRNWNGFATKTGFGIVLEYFCRIGMILRLRQKLDFEYFCPKRKERRGIGLGKFLSKKAKGRKGVGLRINCPSEKGERE